LLFSFVIVFATHSYCEFEKKISLKSIINKSLEKFLRDFNWAFGNLMKRDNHSDLRVLTIRKNLIIFISCNFGKANKFPPKKSSLLTNTFPRDCYIT